MRELVRTITQRWTFTKSADSDALIRRFRPDIYRLALSLTASRDIAEDVTQEVCVRLVKSEENVRQVEAVWPYIRQITVRCGLTAKTTHTCDSLDESTLSKGADPSEAAAVAHVLSKLSPEHRAILALVTYEGLSYDEVSALLDIPSGSVASRLHNAKQQFKKHWEDPS